MSDKVTEEIKRFISNPEIIEEHCALLVVGLRKGDDIKKVMQHVLGSAILRYLKIPITPGKS